MNMFQNLKIMKRVACGFFIITQLVQFELCAADKDIKIEKNTAIPLQLESDVAEIFIANPDIADVQQNNPKVAYIYGKKPGVTSVFATDSNGKVTTIDLTVTHNLTELNKTLHSLHPNEQIIAQSSPLGIILSGSASTSQVAKDIENLATQYIEEGSKVINNMQIDSPTQIMLRVKIAELNRNVITRLGINWSATTSPNNFMFGLIPQFPPTNAAGQFQIPALTPPAYGGYGFQFKDSRNSFTSVLDLLDQEGLATVLAEPNLVALSGETASFLVGGEIPIPVPQGNGQVTIEFKEFGIRLAFVPTVLSPKSINLRVRPEVSALDFDNALKLMTGDLTTAVVPALKTRKAETSVELASGQSFAIAGLLANNLRNQISKLPGLADIPVLGPLFSSEQFQRDQTELIIIVTPYLVKPTCPEALSVPMEGLQYATFVEMIFKQRLNHDETEDHPACLDECHLIGCAGFHME